MNAEEGRTQEGGAHAGAQPTQEEMRERLEEQLRKVRVQDLLLESVVSVLNLAARRIGKEDERDLEQARIGIEAVRALIGLLDPEPAEQVRSALTEVQMLYAKQAGASGPAGQAAAGESGAAGEAGAGEPEKPGQEPAPGGAERQPPSRLWTPPGT